MPARLTVFLPDRPARCFVVDDGKDYVIGRGGGSDLAVDDDRVSRRHARLAGDGGDGWRIADLGSKNGTAVDGRPVGDGAPLRAPGWFSLGGILARLEPLSDQDVRRESAIRLERWRTSIELERQLDPSLGLDQLLRRLMDSVLRLSGAERGFILLAGSDGHLAVAAAVGVAEDELAAAEFSGSVGAVERALAEERAVVVGDAAADVDLGGRPSVVEGGIRALLAIPLRTFAGVIGVVYADRREAGAAFTDLDVEILEAISSHAGLAVTVARVHAELAGLAAGIESAVRLPADTGERLRTDLARAWERAAGAYRPPPAAGGGPGDGGWWGRIVAAASHRQVAG